MFIKGQTAGVGISIGSILVGGAIAIGGCFITSSAGIIALEVLGATIGLGGAAFGLILFLKSADRESKIGQLFSKAFQKENEGL